MKMTMSLTCLVVGMMVSIASCVTSTEPRPPYRGKQIYGYYCQVCHGPEGKGDGYVLFDPPVTDLTAEAIRAKPDEVLLDSIHRGKANTAMGTWRLVLSPQERKEVLAYIRELQKK